jgi:hypothetical protein
MGVDAVRQNYLLGAKITFLIFSFILCVIAVTVQHDIWPFLQTSLPAHADQKPWFVAATLLGFILPLFWLSLDWSILAVRYSLLSLLGMLSLQILTEVAVAHYFFVSMVIPTSILYVGYRIVQLINLQRIVHQSRYPQSTHKWFRTAIIFSNLLLWSCIWVKLTFIIFPQIISHLF